MNTYTFVLHAEFAESADGRTEEEAREALLRSEGKWKVERPNGSTMMVKPSAKHISGSPKHDEICFDPPETED